MATRGDPGQSTPVKSDISPAQTITQQYLPDVAKLVLSVALVFGSAEVIWGNPYLGAIDLALALWMTILVIRMQTVRKARLAGELVLIPGLAVLVASAYLTPYPGYIWSYIGAASIFLLTGRNTGLPIAVVFIGLILICIEDVVDQALMVRVGITLAAVAAISYFVSFRLERLMEKTAVQYRLLENAHQAQLRLIDGVSHELRTPLAAIKGFAEILSQDSSTDGKKAQMLEKVRVNTTFLNIQVSDLIDSSRLRAGTLSYNPRTVAMSELLATVLDDIADIQTLHDTNAKIELRTATPAGLSLDFDQVRTILTHLLIQAVHHKREGQIELQTEYNPHSRIITFRVRDFGTPLSSEAIEGLFSPQPDVGQVAEGPLQGIGLGLHAGQQMATLMGGQISIEPLASGNCMTFTLPATVPVECSAPESDDGYPPAGYQTEKGMQAESSLRAGHRGTRTCPRVLIVDDSETNRMLIGLLLQEMGYEISEAADGEDAIRSFDPYAHDIILMDIQMPGISGIEAARTLRAMGAAAPIFAVSAGTSLLDAAASEKDLFDGFIGKPIDKNLLRDLLQKSSLSSLEAA